MGCGCVILTAIAVIFILKFVNKIKRFFKIPTVPYLEETWWGPRDKSEEDTSIQPFTVKVPDEVITDLQQRLQNARSLTPPLEGIQQQYGINTNLLKKIVDFWRNEYNWKERETFLNKFPQFTVSVQGLRIHYIHVKPEKTDGLKVLPLLMLHGWPGSVREFYEIIPLLTKPQPGRNFVFEVIAPSLPGYGFSEAAVRPGLGAVQVAVLFKNFMNRLGFEKYYIQGGDWGAVIIQHMATLFPEKILGLHSNMCFINTLMSNIKLFLFSFYPTLIVKQEHVHKVYPMSSKFAQRLLESGYMHLQATKPDTVGVALNDSPIGLAAYILEKFITWTNPAWRDLEDGGLTKKYTYTNLLDNVMIYWVTNSITTSMRLYAETLNKNQTKLGVATIPTTVPTACARFTYDISYSPTALLKEKYKNIVYEADYDAGHFPAFEEPELLAKDIYQGIEKIELFHKNSDHLN
ncbi:juvenile hormone epoxide hydrolase 2-like [Tribolium madens]|uniref:juvenile hormone epoxide hydrolase 2-like n=1 Tax=Tribolium madens TaxID=41895 RepID=UPI001CF724A9|nr:juvenile hormone epoxide hydrolase 2-like [Tribolium madens]XP_044270185.1 juvenile hormone epoxide hydrolase 2-like [Tribolium madens]